MRPVCGVPCACCGSLSRFAATAAGIGLCGRRMPMQGEGCDWPEFPAEQEDWNTKRKNKNSCS